MITTTFKEMSAAFQRWNIDVAKDPSQHEDPNPESIEDAENQCKELLSHIADGHQEETISQIKTDTVAAFMEFCKGQELIIPDDYFEEFFGA